MGLIKSKACVICDAGPLIHLDELGCLELLNDFQSVFVPRQVWEEVAFHRPIALKRKDIVLQKVPVKILTDFSLYTLAQTLGLDIGELAALSLMKQYSDAIMLTDDAAARLAAETLKYRVHGTIGVILRAIRRNQKTVDEVLSILRNLPTKSSLHIRSSLLQKIINF